MAQLNITLNQEEILQLLSTDRDEAFRNLLQNSLNSILKAESTAQLKAEPYERTEEREGSRNGFRERPLNTRIGTITLSVPKHRDGEPFSTMIFDNYSRSEAALISCMAEMVVEGVSTRKVSNVMETLCGTSYSKSTVSEACKQLDKAVEEFRNRKLDDSYPFVTFDATYFKARENHRVISKAFMIAYGTNSSGIREILGFAVYKNESLETWQSFLKSLKERGLSGILIATSDAHEGLKQALNKVFPDTPWQRCQFHFAKNISEQAPKKYQAGLRSELTEMFNCETIEDARIKRDEIIADYKDIAESAMTCLDEGFESSMTVMTLPKNLRKHFRTSNHIERINKELKRRSKVIGIFPNEESITRLMGSVLMEINDARASRKAIFTNKTYQELINSAIPAKLIDIAAEQRNLLAA